MARRSFDAVRSDCMTGKVRGWGARAGVTAGVIGIAIATVVAVSPGEKGIALAGTASGAGGEYHPVTPARIVDTREPAIAGQPFGAQPSGPVGPTATFDVQIVGKGGLPQFADADLNGFDDNVLAVAVNITVTEPTSAGWLRAWGKGEPEGESSVVNFATGQTVPNSAILRPGKDGKITVRLFSAAQGTAHVVVDVFGWYSSSSYLPRGARTIPVGPGRIFDSREAAFGATPLAAGQVRKIKIRGASSFDPTITDIVPDLPTVKAVMVNITGVNDLSGSAATYFSALPTAPLVGTRPSTSNLNLSPGAVRASTAIIPIGDDGFIHIYNLAGKAHLVVDVVAYLDQREDDTSIGRVIPLVTPFRAFDTREVEFTAQPLGPARAEDWSFKSFVHDVKIEGVWVEEQSGLLGNLTATNLRRQYDWAPVASFMTAYPSPLAGDAVTPPTISNVNMVEGGSVPNLALLRYRVDVDVEDPYQVRFYNRAGYIDYLLDVYAVILS